MVNDRQAAGYLTNPFEDLFFEVAEALYGVVQIPEPTLFNNQETEEHDRLEQQNRSAFKARLWEMDVDKISIQIPTEVRADPYVTQAIQVDQADMKRFEKTQGELMTMMERFCYQAITRLNKSKSWKYLQYTLVNFFSYYFRMQEHETRKIVLQSSNQLKTLELIDAALERFDQWQKAKGNENRRQVEELWEVPEKRTYSQVYSLRNDIANHALRPYYELDEASRPERKFAELLDGYVPDQILWWYKNGDRGKEHFAVPWIDSTGNPQVFYVDFIVHFAGGQVGLFDTKTRKSDSDAPQKHNGLNAYCIDQTKSAKPTKGSLIIPTEIDQQTVWRYCPNPITQTEDLTGWAHFNPTDFIL